MKKHEAMLCRPGIVSASDQKLLFDFKMLRRNYDYRIRSPNRQLIEKTAEPSSNALVSSAAARW